MLYTTLHFISWKEFASSPQKRFVTSRAGVVVFTAYFSLQLFKDTVDPSGCLKLFEHSTSKALQSLSAVVPSSALPPGRQPCHTLETAYCIEFQLKRILEELAVHLFGKGE